MTLGEAAQAGSPDLVQQAGWALQMRTVGTNVFTQLVAATGSLGGQSGSAVAVDRIMLMIQATSAPANMTQSTDQALGDALGSYGRQMDDIARRAKQAQSDLGNAESALASAQNRLSTYDLTCSSDDSPSRRRSLVSAIGNANSDISAAQTSLRNLDEERRGADSSAASAISAQLGTYNSIRYAMPTPPRVSANVTVTVSMPGGNVQRVSAMDLANLKDPKAIRALWDAMTDEQRAQLIGDVPLLIGNLDGIPLSDRSTANVLTARAYRAEIEDQIQTFRLLQSQNGMESLFASQISDLKAEVKSIDAMLGDRGWKYPADAGTEGRPFGPFTVYDENGERGDQKGLVLVGFNPFRDSYVTYQGALDPVTGDVPAWMEQVGVLVPGTNSRLAGFTSDMDRGQDLFTTSGARAGYFTWHGAPMPRFDAAAGHIVDAAERGFADTAAPRLAAFVNGLQLAPATETVPIAHSYGAAVLGGAEYLGLKADRVVYVSPAGLGHNVESINEFPNTKDAPHFVLQARNDKVVGWNQGSGAFGLGHGSTNPLHAEGVIRLETGYLDGQNPKLGTIESPAGMDTHSTPFQKGSTSMENITGVVRGDPVTLFQKNDVEHVIVPGSGFMGPQTVFLEDEDSGAAKPKIYVDSLHPETVGR